MSQCLSLFKIDSNSDGMDTFPSPSVSLNFSTKPTSVDRPVQKIKNRYQCHRKSLMHKIISLNWLSELRDLTVYSEQMGSVVITPQNPTGLSFLPVLKNHSKCWTGQRSPAWPSVLILFPFFSCLLVGFIFLNAIKNAFDIILCLLN